MALPDRPIAAIVGDGAAMYSIQGLWTAANEKLPITYVIANNRGYRIIKERLLSFRKTDKVNGKGIPKPELGFLTLPQTPGPSPRPPPQPPDNPPAPPERVS